ncbi:MAG TPA: signal peptidase II [Verrucomicrobium sp.]|nr:signal peptidase II [Verrucomicrobium sp.]
MIRLLLLLSLPLYIIDQITKLWVVRNFQLRGPGREVIEGFFTLHYIDNTGIAFGSFNGGEYSNYIFGAVALGALALFTWAYRKGMFPGAFSRVAIALIAAGVCGNFTDRILHHHVVDFLSFDLHIPYANPWPSFNVADACVVVAACLLAIASFKEAPADKDKAQDKVKA